MDQAAIDAIVGAVDFGTVVIGIGAIAGAVALVKVAIAGSRKLLSVIK